MAKRAGPTLAWLAASVAEIQSGVEFLGGPPGKRDDGVPVKDVIEGKLIKGMPLSNVDYVNCRRQEWIYDGDFRNTRFFDLTIEGVEIREGERRHVVYLNLGHEPDTNPATGGGCGIVFDGLVLDDCEANNVAEFKASGLLARNVKVLPSSKIANGLRQRHGTRCAYFGLEGVKIVELRDNQHFLKNAPGTRARLSPGNRPPVFERWKPVHKKSGNEQQGTLECYVDGVKEVELFRWQAGHDQYPVERCFLGPGVGRLITSVPENLVKDLCEGRSVEEWLRALGGEAVDPPKGGDGPVDPPKAEGRLSARVLDDDQTVVVCRGEREIKRFKFVKKGHGH